MNHSGITTKEVFCRFDAEPECDGEQSPQNGFKGKWTRGGIGTPTQRGIPESAEAEDDGQPV